MAWLDHVTCASSTILDIAKLLSNFRSHSELPTHLIFIKLLITGNLVDLEWNGSVLTCISSIVMWFSKCSVNCRSGFLLCKWSVHMFSIIPIRCIWQQLSALVYLGLVNSCCRPLKINSHKTYMNLFKFLPLWAPEMLWFQKQS